MPIYYKRCVYEQHSKQILRHYFQDGIWFDSKTGRPGPPGPKGDPGVDGAAGLKGTSKNKGYCILSNK